MKVEVRNTCCGPEVCPVRACPKVLHRLSKCEQCTRTRITSQYSDCDSVASIVGKRRTYRRSTARNRYINVCAAVCLLLLVSVRTPLSFAAPIMEPGASETEDSKWANPCDYNSSENVPVKYAPYMAEHVASQARNAFNSAESYKEEFAHKTHGYDSIALLFQEWSQYEWVRNYSWSTVVIPKQKACMVEMKILNDNETVGSNELQVAVLPKRKVYGQKMSEAYMDQLMVVIDDVLPYMYKAWKALTARLYSISQESRLFKENMSSGPVLQRKFINTATDARAILCLFKDFMWARKLEILPIYDSEIKTFPDTSVEVVIFYRDTLNFLEYIEQVFTKIAQSGV